MSEALVSVPESPYSGSMNPSVPHGVGVRDSVVHSARQPEAGQVGEPVIVEEDVPGLDVAVNEALGVHVLMPGRRVDDGDLDAGPPRQRVLREPAVSSLSDRLLDSLG